MGEYGGWGLSGRPCPCPIPVPLTTILVVSPPTQTEVPSVRIPPPVRDIESPGQNQRDYSVTTVLFLTTNREELPQLPKVADPVLRHKTHENDFPITTL